ncbi:chemotaxis protein CheW [Halopseudomonas salegens]|uniref:Chemosensory pili system protein ChpC n=1 Tax=Halopseudomonas salegens TaxID=1434072 RepID=A0A1H2HA63_9GAMM|nr:chemotaxis protein CheW [Halopseudomonas salegens]SDU28694.1 chemosensory pili system protein ChpC [Halopseudomonas salegens]
MSDALESLNGLIVPLADRGLLLPNVAVAELSGYRRHEAPPASSPDWFLGWMRWRDQRVAVMDPASLFGLPSSNDTSRDQALVMNAIGGRGGVHFFALRVSGIPRSRKVLRGEISAESEQPVLPGILQQVRLAEVEQPLLIPDLQALEQQLADVGAFG